MYTAHTAQQQQTKYIGIYSTKHFFKQHEAAPTEQTALVLTSEVLEPDPYTYVYNVNI